MNTKESAARLRQEFKSRGWNARKVSVRTEYYSMGSSIHVMIRDAAVSYEEVCRVACGAESIRRCEVSGDILSGGNTYVHVTLSREAEAALTASYLPTVVAAIAEASEADNSFSEHPVGDTGIQLQRFDDHRFNLRGLPDGHARSCWGADGCALTIGMLLGLPKEKKETS